MTNRQMWFGALLSAAAGAALFLGVGAALPVWTNAAGMDVPLWQTVELRAWWDPGLPGIVRLLENNGVVRRGVPTLLLVGGVAGLLVYFLVLGPPPRKGGGA